MSCSHRWARLILASPSAPEWNAAGGKEGLQPFLDRRNGDLLQVSQDRGQTKVVQGCQQGSVSPVIQPTTRFFASHHQLSPGDSPHHRTRHSCSRLPAALTASSERRQWLILGDGLESAGESIRNLAVHPPSYCRSRCSVSRSRNLRHMRIG